MALVRTVGETDAVRSSEEPHMTRSFQLPIDHPDSGKLVVVRHGERVMGTLTDNRVTHVAAIVGRRRTDRRSQVRLCYPRTIARITSFYLRAKISEASAPIVPAGGGVLARHYRAGLAA